MPHSDGVSLGTHLTKTLWGNVLLGPTATYIDDKNDYERNRIPVEEFARGARELLPDIEPFRSGARIFWNPSEVDASAERRPYRRHKERSWISSSSRIRNSRALFNSSASNRPG